jgi:cytochrome P450
VPPRAKIWSLTLCAADQGGALSEQEMLSTIFQLVVAGHDTTASLIGNGTVALLHPEQRDALVADPALMPHAIEEVLRWDAPVPHSTLRYTSQDVALGGTVIPTFAQVIISLAGTRPGTPNRRPSTSPGRTPATWPSATASTTAWVPG